MPAEIVNVTARGNLGRKIDLKEIIIKIRDANFNEFGGGMAEIAYKKKIKQVEQDGELTFEVCSETDDFKIAKIRLFSSGKFTINCPDPEFIPKLEIEFIKTIKEIL
jgi:TATA-box binding protein (TBP) (component of TFIID and TFIIIB)